MRLLRLLAAAGRSVPKVVPLMRHGTVPLWLKISTIAAAALVISPIDIFGDIPVLGTFDDAVLLVLLAGGFVAFAERYLARRALVPVRA